MIAYRSEMELKLVAACKSGDDSLVLSLINSGVNVNCLVKIDGSEWSPLLMATDKGRTDVVQLLLERGAQVDLQDNDGLTALIWANVRGHTEIVNVLLERGAQVDLQNNVGWTALMMASGTEIVEVLLERGAQIDLLDSDGLTALMRASDRGHTEIVNVLLERGAQVDLQDNDGQTALMWASVNGCTEIVKVLLERGAQIDLLDNDGWTALIVASDNGHTEIVKVLLQRGAQIDLQNNVGSTALMMASDNKDMDIAKLLMGHGAKVGRDHVLVAACMSGDDSLVLSLINSGVNVNCLVVFERYVSEWSPLMGASAVGRTDVVEVLLQRGALVDLQNNDDEWTALMWASQSGHVETTQLLLEHGARVDIDGYSDRDTAMNLADSQEMVDLLMSAMVPQLINLLQPVAHKWRELGEHLGLKETTLNQCYSSAKKEEGRLQAVMNTWSQQNDPRPTWRALIRAVKMVDRDSAQNMDQLVGKY